eukprot:TRINITY_DN2055_c0_g1_i9.p2 TRINITY_DN2055_c0_g1~~TRINITY_DN2055_c0_g1_i9.p2  ORF type:complete len:171 (+),score=31.43 TRINITY_DN2055_c0_g1_i9:148-660(+)
MALLLYAIAIISLVYILITEYSRLEIVSSFVVGLLFGLGLCVSGMCRRSHVLSFLQLGPSWNPSLAVVMATAVLINFFTFSFTLKRGPLCGGSIGVVIQPVDWSVVVGPATFGVGWGMAGICPGPAMANAFYAVRMAAFIPSMAVGMMLGDTVKNEISFYFNNGRKSNVK